MGTTNGVGVFELGLLCSKTVFDIRVVAGLKISYLVGMLLRESLLLANGLNKSVVVVLCSASNAISTAKWLVRAVTRTDTCDYCVGAYSGKECPKQKNKNPADQKYTICK